MTTDWADVIRATSLALGEDTARAMSLVDPSEEKTYLPVGTGQAVYCGEGSPLTQVSWLGYKTDFDPNDLTEVEAFFSGRAAHWEYIVTPCSAPGLLTAVIQRGWTEAQYENVMGCQIETDQVDLPTGVQIEVVKDEDRRAWAELAMKGFFTDTVPPGFENLNDILIKSKKTVGFVATYEGVPAGAASLMVGGEAAYLGGASTLPDYRGNGIQTALLQARLAYARSLGIGLGLCECLVGSQSQRNQERAGFKVVCTKIVLTRPNPELPQ